MRYEISFSQGSLQHHLHEERNREDSNDPTSSVNRNGINGIVNPDGNHQSGQELVGESPNGSYNGGGPRSKDVAARAEGDHPSNGAVDGADERVLSRHGFRYKETNNPTTATRHLKVKQSKRQLY